MFDIAFKSHIRLWPLLALIILIFMTWTLLSLKTSNEMTILPQPISTLNTKQFDIYGKDHEVGIFLWP
jgi:hypothetical protein